MSEASATLHTPFASATRQREAVVFGLWIFLASELLLFGGIFFGYFVYRHAQPAAFATAGHETEIGVWVTFALGLMFLAVKGLEYREDFAERLWPGATFALHDPATRIFFSFYWVMTGLHAVHITAGLICIGRLGWLARTRKLNANTDSVEATTLYWHLVDVVWTLLYPCLYLVGR